MEKSGPTNCNDYCHGDCWKVQDDQFLNGNIWDLLEVEKFSVVTGENYKATIGIKWKDSCGNLAPSRYEK